MPKKLRQGFTTGTAAAAAAKGAVVCLLQASPPRLVSVELLTGDRISIPIHGCCRGEDGSAACTVIKDAGDDPDVTHGAEIGARARILQSRSPGAEPSAVLISGGEGVGRITKPGLELPPGEPAINPGPRRMITRAVEEVLAAHGTQGLVAVEIFVPRGVDIARKTLNARLGILGGISILGTTGIVRPMSHQAFMATIEAGLSVARACGLNRVVLTTGRRSERFAQACWPDLPEESFVQIGDFFQESLTRCVAKGFAGATLAVFFGKGLKMAQGAPHTHAARSRLSLDDLADRALHQSGDPELAERIRACNTARQALGYLHPGHLDVIAEVGRRIIAAAGQFTGPGLKIRSVIFDYEGKMVFDSEKEF
ncbi:MAG: cobalt-precorrin-5B (C(1))-methyltransferase CbiD [Hyphomicrobiales bacterium]